MKNLTIFSCNECKWHIFDPYDYKEYCGELEREFPEGFDVMQEIWDECELEDADG